jgi:hypothetical protein
MNTPTARFRVLVTGSRAWTDHTAITAALDGLLVKHVTRLVVVHGACQHGADAFADLWARFNWVPVQRHPADWRRHGRRAGMLRNLAMVATKPNLCLAFIHNNSAGATHCAQAAEAAGIPTRVYRSGVTT